MNATWYAIVTKRGVLWEMSKGETVLFKSRAEAKRLVDYHNSEYTDVGLKVAKIRWEQIR